MKLQLGYEYKLDSISEIKVSNSFLGISEDDRGCLNDEKHKNCTTRYFVETALKLCHCLPFQIRTTDNVKPFKIDYSCKRRYALKTP